MKNFGKIVLGILFVAALVGTLVFLWKKSRPEQISYSTAEPVTATITKRTVATGKVNPRDEVNIVPQISGIVSQLLKEAGQTVKKDEVIARIKVIPDVGTLNNAETQVENATLNLDLATQDYERASELFKQGVVTKEEFQRSENSYLSAKKALASAENNLDIVKNGVTSKYASYSNTNIRSTVSGTILSVPVKVGNSVIQANTMNAGTTIATVADMNDMQFVGNIDETEVGSLHEGMDIRVSVGAIKDMQFPAKLEYISPKSTEENGAVLFEIKAAVKIPEGVFVRAGYSANAEIILSEVRDVMTIPESTISFKDGKAYVDVLTGGSEGNQQWEQREIQIGLSDGINAEVKNGLEMGEQVKSSVIKSNK